MNRLSLIVFMLIAVMAASCSSGGDEHAQALDTSSVGMAKGIDGIMGYHWGDGTDVLIDHSVYEKSVKGSVEDFSYVGDPYSDDFINALVDYDRFEFVDGGLVGAEFVGNNFDDMEKMRVYLTGEYGEPQEQSDGYYKWVSATGTLVLQDAEDNWSLMGWSSDAPEYWR